MGREVRRVPADWQHPTDERGNFIPLYGRSYSQALADWNLCNQKWQEGLQEDWKPNASEKLFKPKEGGALECEAYTDWDGPQPRAADYMPDWPADQRTHLMMYEDTSEGTPISPAFATPEELARWLADNGASSFGSMTASYEQWLSVARGGWAPSMVIDSGHMMSGVEAMARPEGDRP